MNNIKQEKRNIVLNIIYFTFTLALIVIVTICAVFFTIGKVKAQDEKLKSYRDGTNYGISIDNLENLSFMTVDDVVEYKKLVIGLMEENKINATSFTVLDTISLSKNNTYEWYAVCNDENQSTFLNSFTASGDNSISVSLQEKEDVSSTLTDEQVEKIRDMNNNNEEANNGYLSGDINNLEAIDPTINDDSQIQNALGQEDYKKFISSFRKFLFETNNSRRNFEITPNSFNAASGKIVFSVQATTILNKNNLVKIVYDENVKTFNFEYAD